MKSNYNGFIYQYGIGGPKDPTQSDYYYGLICKTRGNLLRAYVCNKGKN